MFSSLNFHKYAYHSILHGNRQSVIRILKIIEKSILFYLILSVTGRSRLPSANPTKRLFGMQKIKQQKNGWPAPILFCILLLSLHYSASSAAGASRLSALVVASSESASPSISASAFAASSC